MNININNVEELKKELEKMSSVINENQLMEELKNMSNFKPSYFSRDEIKYVEMSPYYISEKDYEKPKSGKSEFMEEVLKIKIEEVFESDLPFEEKQSRVIDLQTEIISVLKERADNAEQDLKSANDRNKEINSQLKRAVEKLDEAEEKKFKLVDQFNNLLKRHTAILETYDDMLFAYIDMTVKVEELEFIVNG